MARVLIAFASHYGQTRRIAAWLAEQLRSLGQEVELAELSADLRGTPPPEDYDVVVLGSRVEVGRLAPSLGAYAREHAAALRDMPVAAFSVSLAPHAYLSPLTSALGFIPARIAAFAGALRYRRYHLATRLVMKWMSRRAGLPTDTSQDHEFTDWAAVRRFAVDIASLCPRPRLEVVRF